MSTPSSPSPDGREPPQSIHHLAIHELRSVISVVRGHAQLAQRRIAKDSTQASAAALLALTAIERATRIAERSLHTLERSKHSSDKDEP